MGTTGVVAGLVLAVVLVAGSGAAGAQEPTRAPLQPPVPRERTLAPVLVVLDASGSMRGDDGTGRSKMETAREALLQLITELPDRTPVGLRVYGHRVAATDRARGCEDTELLVPVGPLDRDRLRVAVNGLQPTGYTPIGASLRAAAADLAGAGPRTVVLISDGIDECGPPDPCDVARELAAADVELRVETIGFQTEPEAAAQMRCVAEVTGGRFLPADNAGELLRALRSYQVQGALLSGAPELEQAVDGAELTSGQYRDSLQVGEQRWYAVRLEAGQTLRSAATIVGAEGGSVSPSATFAMEVRGDDVLGELSCGTDEAERIGQEARQVRVDGLTVQEQGLCRDPGRYLVGLRLDDVEGRSPIEGEDFEVELLVDVVDAEVGAGGPAPRREPDPAAPVPTGAPADLPVAEPAGAGSGGGRYVLAAALAGLAGLGLGAFAAWRLGP